MFPSTSPVGRGVLGHTMATLTSRRRFIGGGAAAAAGLFLGGSLITACGSDTNQSAHTTPEDDGPATGTLRISNWPLYMTDGFVAAFQKASGLTVDYKEDFNDPEQWFSKVKESLARRQDIGADLVVMPSFLMARMHDLGWLDEINQARVPNLKNLRPDLLDARVDPGRKFSAPYMSGLVGLAYNRAQTGRDITKIDDLWDPKFKGRVSLFSDVQDGLGMIMLSQGSSIDTPTTDTVNKAIDEVREQKDRGQIRQFTGNDYASDLAAGNILVAQAYSGDVVQLQADNPDLRFVVPETGATTFVDNMVIPYTTQNQKAAEAWINYVYDRANYAKLVAFVHGVPVLSDMTAELNKIDPAAANNPWINPSPEILNKSKAWGPLTAEQTHEYSTAYAAVTSS
jgi:spermidine/putrescine transport system substrate-binding protein